jgi:peptide/histidine transporter 3/4
MAIFGAEQIREQKSTTQYFDKYYVAVNTGGLLAFGGMAYIQQNVGWFTGHVVSTVLLGVTGILFLTGYQYYIHIKPHDSVITNFFPILFNAFQTWRKHRRPTSRIVHKCRSADKRTLLRDQDDRNDYLSFEVNERPISFFDYAKVANNGRFQDRVVDEIKSLRRIIAMFLLLVPYWIIYLQVFRIHRFQLIFIYLERYNVYCARCPYENPSF